MHTWENAANRGAHMDALGSSSEDCCAELLSLLFIIVGGLMLTSERLLALWQVSDKQNHLLCFCHSVFLLTIILVA